jgi:PAS domain S-box-containing protein
MAKGTPRPETEVSLPVHVLIPEARSAEAELLLRQLRRAGIEPDVRRLESEPVPLALFDLPADLAHPVSDRPGSDLPGPAISFVLVPGVLREQTEGAGAPEPGASGCKRMGEALAHVWEQKRMRDDKRRAEADLREAEACFALLADSARECALVPLNPGGCVASWNAGAERLLGYVAEEVLGRHLSCLYRREDRAGAEAALKAAEAHGRWEGECWHLRADGTTFCASTTITALCEEAGPRRGFAFLTRDLTESKRRQDSDRQREELAARSRIVHAILQPQDLDERLNTILVEALRLLGGDNGGIYVVEGKQVVLRAWRGISETFRAQVKSFPVEQAPDWMKGPRLVCERLNEAGPTPDYAKREGIQSWACVLLTITREGLTEPRERTEWLGAIVVGSRQYAALREEDLSTLQAMGEQLAVAIDHARHCREAAALRKETADLRQALEDRKVIERAKGVLMKKAHLDEPQAFRRLQKLASDNNRKLAEIAQMIVTAEEALAPLERS